MSGSEVDGKSGGKESPRRFYVKVVNLHKQAEGAFQKKNFHLWLKLLRRAAKTYPYNRMLPAA